MSSKKVTFADIAEYTNFSKTTVSRFFNRPETLSEKNKLIIRQALIDLDYKENKVARILAKGKTEIIGVLIPSLFLDYFAEMLTQILNTYEHYGYKFLVFIGHEDQITERAYLEELMAYQIEGLIIMSHTTPSEELAALPIPVVTIEREDKYISSVNCDNYMGAVQAVSLLAKHNCDILFHINTPTAENIPSYQRILGFQDFCRDHQIKHEIHILDVGFSMQTVLSAIIPLFQELEEKYPTERKGLFFSNDTIANFFLNLLIRRFGNLPDTYRIVGFDNSPIAEKSIYTLSTVGQQIDKIAQEAVSLLVQQIRDRKKGKHPDKPVHKVVTPVLYRRETTEYFSEKQL